MTLGNLCINASRKSIKVIYIFNKPHAVKAVQNFKDATFKSK